MLLFIHLFILETYVAPLH